jgi:hypothetical protein
MRLIDGWTLACGQMSASSIGIQVIMPETGTSPKQTPPPQPDKHHDSGNAAFGDAPKQAPPPPGMGKLLDKTV